MNLSGISQKLSEVLTDELNYSNDKKDIVAYGIETLTLSIVGFAAVLVVGILFNALVPTIIAAFFGGMLRKLSGGAHFNTPLKCLSFGAIVYSLIGVLSNKIIIYNFYNVNILLIILILSLILVAILAPVDCESKPIHSSSFRKKLKMASIILVISTFVIVLISKNSLINTSAVIGVGYQTLTLLPVFNYKKKEV